MAFKKGNKLAVGRAAPVAPIMNFAGVTRVAQSHAEEMILIQVQIAQNRKNPPHVRLEAAEKVLNRAVGKPHQSVEVTRVDGNADKSAEELKLAFLDKLSRLLGDSPPELIEADAVDGEADDAIPVEGTELDE